MNLKLPDRKVLVFKSALIGIIVHLCLTNTLYGENRLDFYQDDRIISGNVTSDDGKPLPGVNIVIEGTIVGTTTDANGGYSISASDDAILIFSFVGFLKISERVGSRTTIDVELQPDLQFLQEVVVIGYGTQKLAEVTTAIASVKPEDFISGAVRNVGEAIRGKVAGLSVTTASGNPNAETELRLRGITSIVGSSSPLVLIDGYPGSLDAVSQNDIESIEVLKDASAAAIYGTRAANGVILITTKKVKGIMAPLLEYSAYYAGGQFSKKLDFQNAQSVRNQISQGNIAAGYDEGYDTDWLGEVTQTPHAFFNNLTFRSGTEKSNYVANMSFRDEVGVMKKSGRREYIGRVEINQFVVEDKLEATFKLLHGRKFVGNRSYGENEGGSDAGSFSDGFEGIYRQAIIRNPTDRLKDDDGSWQERGLLQYSNPVGRLAEEIFDDESDYTWITGGLTYNPILNEDLSIKFMASQNVWNTSQGSSQTKRHYSSTVVGRNGLASISNSKLVENFVDLYANYSTVFNDHRITSLLGYSYLDQTRTNSSMTNYDFPTDLFSYHAIELGRALGENMTGSGVNSGKNDWTLISFFGRIGYGFSNRYNILASLRYEGSSKFGENEKWGAFPAVSAGWTISNEQFLSNASTISNLKLRIGYGVTGSVPNQSYLSLTSFGFSSNEFFYSGGEWKSILQPNRNANPNLKWERNNEYNIGIDFGLFSNKFYGSIDYYNRTVENLLFNFPVPVPPNLINSTLANAAEMSNKGIEVALNYVLTSANNNFQWRTNLNFSRNVNKLVSLSADSTQFSTRNPWFDSGYTGAPIQQSTHRNFVGEPMGNFYGWNSVDIDGNGEWIIENETGELKPLADVTSDDRTILGNGQPTTFVGWNNYFTFKKWDFSVTMRGAFDYQILNFSRMFYENPASQYNKLESAFDPVYGKQMLTSPLFYVSHYIEDGDYWKIDNLSLGYTFNPKSFSARVYTAVSNMAVFTGYTGIDPEVRRNALSPGNDSRDTYPSIRTYTIGFDFKF